jgi:hypothetical protein
MSVPASPVDADLAGPHCCFSPVAFLLIAVSLVQRSEFRGPLWVLLLPDALLMPLRRVSRVEVLDVATERPAMTPHATCGSRPGPANAVPPRAA